MIFNLHRVAPLVLLAGAFGCGIWLASSQPLPMLLLLGAGSAAVACAWLLRRDALAFWCALWIAALALGATRFAIDDAALRASPTTPYHGETVTLEGVIEAEPDERVNDYRLRIRPTRLIVESDDVTPVDGFSDVVLVRADKSVPWRYGDAVRVLGRMDAPPRLPEFDYRAYLAQNGVLSWISRPERVWLTGENEGEPVWRMLYALKARVRRAVKAILPTPESALLNGILIGDDNELPERVQEAFRITGTSHIVAISGFNVSLVIGTLLIVLGRLMHARRVALVALPLIWLYAVFVGAGASVVRAVTMASIGLVGQLFWRKGQGLNTLAGAVLIMLIADPNALFDVGLQLSASATGGLMLYASKLQQPFETWLEARVQRPWLRGIAGALGEAVLVSIAAQITTLPLLLWHFGSLSLVMLLANALVLPYQPLLMGLGVLAAVVGSVSTQVGTVIGLPVYALLTLTLRIIDWLAGWPLAALRVEGFGAPFVAAYYAALIAITQTRLRENGPRAMVKTLLRWGALVALLAVGAAGVSWFYQRPDGRLRVTFAGNGALVVLPDGRQLIYGNAADVLNSEGRVLPFWDREVDWVVPGERSERARGNTLRLLRTYNVGALLQPPLPRDAIDEPSRALDEWNEAVAASVRSQPAAMSGTMLIDEPELGVMLLGLGGNRQGLRIMHGAQRIDLLGEGDLVSPGIALGDIVFGNVRSRNLVQALQRDAPRWVVWQDSGTAQTYTLHARTRWLPLRERGRVEFVADRGVLVLKE